jgi:hypothetical protein
LRLVFSNNTPDNPCQEIVGMRCEAVHDDLGVDDDIVWLVVTGDLPPPIVSVLTMLAAPSGSNVETARRRHHSGPTPHRQGRPGRQPPALHECVHECVHEFVSVLVLSVAAGHAILSPLAGLAFVASRSAGRTAATGRRVPWQGR